MLYNTHTLTDTLTLTYTVAHTHTNGHTSKQESARQTDGRCQTVRTKEGKRLLSSRGAAPAMFSPPQLGTAPFPHRFRCFAIFVSFRC